MADLAGMYADRKRREEAGEAPTESELMGALFDAGSGFEPADGELLSAVDRVFGPSESRLERALFAAPPEARPPTGPDFAPMRSGLYDFEPPTAPEPRVDLLPGSINPWESLAQDAEEGRLGQLYRQRDMRGGVLEEPSTELEALVPRYTGTFPAAGPQDYAEDRAAWQQHITDRIQEGEREAEAFKPAEASRAPSWLRGRLQAAGRLGVQFLGPFVRSVEKYGTAAKKTVSPRLWVEPRVDRILDAEVAFRQKLGLFTNEQRRDESRHRADVRRELMEGFPMYASAARRQQGELYQVLAELEPTELPEAHGFYQKVARFGGEVGAFIAELEAWSPLFRGPAAVIGRRAAAGAPVAAEAGALATTGQALREMERAKRAAHVARAAQETMGAGALAATEGQDPIEAMAHFAPIPAMSRLPVGPRAAGQAAYFATNAAARGAPMDEILIESVIGPALFAAPDLMRFATRARGAPYGDAEWRSWTAKEDSITKKMIHRWHKLSEERPPAWEERARYEWEGELRGTSGSLMKLYQRTFEREPKGMSVEDVKLIRDFVWHFAPDAIYRGEAVMPAEGTKGRRDEGENRCR